MLYNWIKIAFRNFAKNKIATTINVFGLTIGMLAIILSFLYWKDELNYNQWNPYKNEVHQVIHDVGDSDGLWSTAVYPEGPTLKERFPEVTDYLYIEWQEGALIRKGNTSTYLYGLYPATSNFFEFFPFEFTEGSPNNALSDLQSIAISEKWKAQLFGEKNALGETIAIEDKNYIVKGVYKNEMGSAEQPDAVIPLDWDKTWEDYGDHWGMFASRLYIKLKPGSYSKELLERMEHETFYTKQAVPEAKREGISIEEYYEKYGETKIDLEPLHSMRLFSKGDGGNAGKGNLTIIYIQTGLAVLILILSCVNFINLTTANAMKRAKEVGIRKTLGAQRKNILLQFMLEVTFLCVFALILALVFAEILLPYYNEYLNKAIKLEVYSLLGYIFLVLVIVILISGVFPSLYLSNFQPLKVLKGNFTRSKSGIWIRNTLMGVQFFISAFFFIGGIIVYLQVHYMMHRDLGFNPDQTVVVYMNNYNENRYNKYELIKQSFQNVSGIENISSGMRVPGYRYNNSSQLYYLDRITQATNCAMDFNFLDLLDINIQEGRALSAEISSDTIQNILVNESLLKELGITDPINTEVESGMNNQKFKIVGVVEDYFIEGFNNQIKPTIYFHWNTVDWQKNNLSAVLFKINPEQMETALKEIEKRWTTEIEPGYPFKYAFVDKQFAKTYLIYEKQKDIFFILTIVVILIASLGLFGLVSFIIEQRMKEISIRKVLGASPRDLVKMFSKNYLLIAAAAILCNLPITYYLMKRWLEDFVYRIDIPIWPFALAFIALLALTFIIIAVRTLYATNNKPTEYLKYE